MKFEQLDMFSTETIDSLIGVIITMNPDSYDKISIVECIEKSKMHFDMKIDLKTVQKFEMFWKWQESNSYRLTECYYIRIWLKGTHKGEWAVTGISGSVGMMWYSNSDYGEQYVIDRLKMLIDILNGGEDES